MSLINKMLQDLEARQDAAAPASAVYEDLRPIRSASRFNALHVGIALAVVAVLAAGIYYTYTTNQTARPTVEPRTPVPTAEGEPIKSATSVTALVPNTGGDPVASTPRDAPKPAAAVSNVAAPLSAPAKSAAAANTQMRRSPATAPAGIVKSADTPHVVARSHERRPTEARASKPKIDPVAANDAETAPLLMDKKIRPLTADESAEASYRRAVQLLEQSRPEESLSRLHEALLAQPTHIKARELAAGIELQNGHWREAENLLEEGLRQVSNHYLFARMLARVYIDHGAETKALAVMESALPSGSRDAEFSALLGLLYQRAGRGADAVKAYERAVDLQPNDGRAWLGFAIALESTAQASAATNAYRRAQESGLAPALARYAEQRLAALGDR